MNETGLQDASGGVGLRFVDYFSSHIQVWHNWLSYTLDQDNQPRAPALQILDK